MTSIFTRSNLGPFALTTWRHSKDQIVQPVVLQSLEFAMVIANWSHGLLRDTGGILLDMSPDPALAEKLRNTVEGDGDRLTDLHLWRLGPGHLGAILSVVTATPRDAAFYRDMLSRFKSRSHVTVEVSRVAA